ncbi:MAG: hypothetical protein JO069_00910 [Verrucomicrobia bacterium]|nr:hypothetical protein [Verrucomicrobiota bacterium]
MAARADGSLQKRLLAGTLICVVCLGVGYWLFVGTPWGHHVDEGAYFGRQAVGQRVVQANLDVLDLVSEAALVVAGGILLAIAAVRRCVLVGVLAVVGFGGAVVGAELLKHTLPWHPLMPGDGAFDQGLQANTYPSGHTTVGTSFVLSLLLTAPSRWRPWLAVAGGWVSATFATGVLFAGWHRASDSLGALAWSGLCMTLVAAVVVRWRGRPSPAAVHPGRAVLGSAALAMLVTAAIWARVAPRAPEYPEADLPFLALSGFIMVCAFFLTAWYGWQLRAVDWVEARRLTEPPEGRVRAARKVGGPSPPDS